MHTDAEHAGVRGCTSRCVCDLQSLTVTQETMQIHFFCEGYDTDGLDCSLESSIRHAFPGELYTIYNQSSSHGKLYRPEFVFVTPLAVQCPYRQF